MKRRDFLAAGTTGTLGVGLAGCSAFGLGSVDVKSARPPLEFEKKVPKPKGTMPMTELGKTGIKVSKFGFGSHMMGELRKREDVREWMIREAYDLGMNLFDVYDIEGHAFQYEPMGRYLAPMINDVVISISLWPYEGRTLEQELERDLRLFGRDYIDLVRIHHYKDHRDDVSEWDWWEKLFKWKEEGKIRAVGVPIHSREDLKAPLAELPLDYVILPYNFYHNYAWSGYVPDKFDSVIPEIHKIGIGLITMKPFASDGLVTPFKRLATRYDDSGEVNYAKACLRYIQNSDINADSTIGGMNNPYHVYENINAYFNPAMSDEEKKVLIKIRKTAKIAAKSLLPEHYKFLEEWVPDKWDDSDLFG